MNLPKLSSDTPANDALAICDDAGISLRLDGERISVEHGPEGFPEAVRVAIVANRRAIIQILTAHPRPQPVDVWLVAANLDVAFIPFEMIPPSGMVYFGERAYFALTPKLWAEMLTATDAMFRRPDGSYPTSDPNYLGVCQRLSELTGYVRAYFRPDQIERAIASIAMGRNSITPHRPSSGKRTKADSQPHAACS